MHGADDTQLSQTSVADLLRHHEIGNDADHAASARQHRICEPAHQTYVSAAVHQFDSAFNQQHAKSFSRVAIGRTLARARTAKNADAMEMHEGQLVAWNAAAGRFLSALWQKVPRWLQLTSSRRRALLALASQAVFFVFRRSHSRATELGYFEGPLQFFPCGRNESVFSDARSRGRRIDEVGMGIHLPRRAVTPPGLPFHSHIGNSHLDVEDHALKLRTLCHGACSPCTRYK